MVIETKTKASQVKSTAATNGSAKRRKDDAQEQLLALFEKRNELKREYDKQIDALSVLREQHQVLQSQYEKTRAQLDGVEEVLLDPARAQTAVLYYRFHSIWRQCADQLKEYSATLKAEFETREKQSLLEEFTAQAASQQQALEKKVEFLRDIESEFISSVDDLKKRLAAANRPWHFFKRRKLAAELEALTEQRKPAAQQLEETVAELKRVRDRKPPEYKGLSPRSKREINLRLIALAQYFFVIYSENSISRQCFEAQGKPPNEVNYGSREECLEMEKPLAAATKKMLADDKRKEKLDRRYALLKESVEYQGNGDVLPLPGCLQRIQLSVVSSDHMDVTGNEVAVNVLEHNYWDVKAAFVE